MLRGFRLWLALGLLLPPALSACGGGGHSTPAPVATPTPVTSASPTPDPAAFVCPSSDSIVAASGSRSLSRRVALRGNRMSASGSLIEVTYNRAVANVSTAAIAQRELQLGAGTVRTLDYPSLNLVTHVLAVPPSQIAATEAALRRQSGVISVTLSSRRYPSTVSGPYFPNDPYFNGFSTTEAPQAGATKPPSTYHVAPYEESADVPGQWDMHVIKLEHAFAYSQGNNGSAVNNPNALGSSTIKIAVIDTGEDPTGPELQSKIVHQRCFITNTTTNVQSTSNFAPDPQGHGTNVSGIAAADTNNSFGFTGAGGNVVIYAYRVFPTPDDNCALDSTTTDPQCSADSSDLASAVNDAVAQHVNVISISLGADQCTNGVDPDSAENNAVLAALNQNIIVVAAAGNDSNSAIEAPACRTGVLAVGASALDDGQSNGTGSAGGSASSPVEYVASYSNYGSPASALRSANAWGIVAPGGDPVSDTDPDDLHWIENIWTSTPYDQNFEGDCTDDYPNDNNPVQTAPLDCTTLIAGTSMSTPHVAGAAALILSVNSSYQTPAKMKQLLCSTADDIGASHEGCGRLNVYRAMATALADPNLP